MFYGLTSDKIMQLGVGFWGSKTLLSAIELGMFTEQGSGRAAAGCAKPYSRKHVSNVLSLNSIVIGIK
jgi:hypothetical protein